MREMHSCYTYMFAMNLAASIDLLVVWDTVSLERDVGRAGRVPPQPFQDSCSGA